MNIRALQEQKKSAIIAPRNKIGGVTMATNRDYGKEYEREKARAKIIPIKVSPELFDAFTAKTERDGTSKNAVLKACAEAYTYGNLILDENGKPQIKG